MATGSAVWTPDVIDISGLKVAMAKPQAPSNGFSLLFVHGMWCGAWVWENYLRFFSALGYACYALNLRGHHGSGSVRDIGKVSIHAYVEDVRQVASALGNPVLVGHSMGGLIVQKLAELLDPPAVVLITPGAPRGILAINTLLLLQVALKYAGVMLLRRPLTVDRPDANRLTMNRLSPEDQADVYNRLVPESGWATLEMAVLGLKVNESEVRSPMLLIAAGEDNTTPARMIGKIARKYRAECREYADRAHLIMIEPGWKRVAEDIAVWLKRVRQDASPVAGSRLEMSTFDQ
jgi:pimeloyl-ACP methyl ester carboxylesterase